LSKLKEKLLLLSADVLAVNLALLFVLWIRYEGGHWEYLHHLWRLYGGGKGAVSFSFVLRAYLGPAGVLSLYWVVLFAFYGLYRSWRARSRLDEGIAVAKVVTVGVVVLFLATLDLSHPFPSAKMAMLAYWGGLLVLVGGGRLGIRSFQRHLLIKGIGRRRAVIVGSGERGRTLLEDLRKYPALGYEVVGFVRGPGDPPEEVVGGTPVLGTIEELPEVVRRYCVEEVLLAPSPELKRKVPEIISACDGLPVTFSAVPDIYDIISGYVRTNQIYGLPLIELLPDFMPPWERAAKRALDIVVSIVVLLGGAPLWLLIAIIIKLESKGPVFYLQERVGKDGRIFWMYKFRSMIEDAEKYTGPVWATEDDPRITKVGRVLRKLRLDEVPQFFNVLKGEMSLVGPRPERPYFVAQLMKIFPLYIKRLRVAPGITGWAQVKWGYDRSLEDVQEKLKYDLFYIENMSLRMDLKILLRTVWVALRGKGAY